MRPPATARFTESTGHNQDVPETPTQEKRVPPTIYLSTPSNQRCRFPEQFLLNQIFMCLFSCRARALYVMNINHFFDMGGYSASISY
jgi:hypothetical protein